MWLSSSIPMKLNSRASALYIIGKMSMKITSKPANGAKLLTLIHFVALFFRVIVAEAVTVATAAAQTEK